jgi:quercetin dioxygenase-like cupin family protein
MIGGKLAVRYQDGRSEATKAGDLFYWPPGHTIKAEADSEFVLFSPQEDHTPVLDHVKNQLG